MATFRSLLVSTPLFITPVPVNARERRAHRAGGALGNRLLFQHRASAPDFVPKVRAFQRAVGDFEIDVAVERLHDVVGVPARARAA